MNNILIIDKNIDLLINNIPSLYGGATIQTLSWIKGFVKNGYKPIICSENDLCNDKYDSVFINTSNRYTSFFKYIYAIIKYKPKFIYISTPSWSHIFCLFASKIFQVPVVQRISNNNFSDDRVNLRFGNFKARIWKYYIRNIDLILCQNKYQYSQLNYRFPIVKKMILYNPYEISENSPIKSISNNYVAWIGIFQYQKNFLALYDIAKSLKKIKFKIAGKPYANIDNETSKYFKKLKQLKNVEFIGLLDRSKVKIFLSNSLCLLNTSRYEGFSNTFLEALEVEIPIITTKTTDPDRIIEKNKFGIVVDKFSDLKNAIVKINNLKYNRKSRSFLKKNFDPNIISRKLINEITNTY